MDTPHEVPTIVQIKHILQYESDKLTPSMAHQFLLIVSSVASEFRTQAGQLEAKYALMKADFIKQDMTGVKAKALASGSETGMLWAEIKEEIRGLDEIAKALKKSLQHFENEGKGIY